MSAMADIKAPDAPDAFELVEKGHGWAITDDDRMTLYTSKSDTQPGKSNCVDDCAETWPPYLASEDAATGNGWSVITRVDQVGRRRC